MSAGVIADIMVVIGARTVLRRLSVVEGFEEFDRDGAMDLALFHRQFQDHRSLKLAACPGCNEILFIICTEPGCDFRVDLKTTNVHRMQGNGESH